MDAIKLKSKVRDLIIDEPVNSTFKVHSDIYTDPEIFEMEMKLIFESTWLFLAHESQIPEPNDYMTLFMGRQPVILVRDEKGKIKCFFNHCSHRGSRVCHSEIGNSSRFRCPYHGWTYNNSGRLVGVPDRNAYPQNFDQHSHGLVEAPKLDVFKGFIFASLNSNVPTLEEHLGPAKPYLELAVDRYPNSEIQVNRGVSKYGYDGNWKLQIENSMDYYHVLFVHRSWMDMVKERTGYDIDSSFKYGSANNAVYFGSGHGATIARGDMLESSYVGQGSLYPPNFRDEAWEQRVGPLKSKWAKKFSEHLLIFPNLLIMEAPAMQIRVVRPLAPDKTEVTGYSYYPKGMPPEYIAKNLRAYEDFLGPSGNGTPDDLAAFRLNHEGFQAKGAPWSDLSKGYTRETSDIDLQELGPLEAAGEITDDTHYRGFYRYWRDLLSQD